MERPLVAHSAAWPGEARGPRERGCPISSTIISGSGQACHSSQEYPSSERHRLNNDNDGGAREESQRDC